MSSAARASLLIAVVAVLASLATLRASPVAALCAYLAVDDPIPGDAQYVLVGTVAETGADGQNALIHVDEIWKGAPLPEWVPLIGTDDPNVVWEDSAQFTVGERYLVVADREGSAFRPRGCGYSTPFTAELAVHAPPHFASPFAVPRPMYWQPGVVPWLWLGVLAGAALFVATLALRWRQGGRGRRSDQVAPVQ